MTRPRARALHKSGQNGKSGSGDTIGIRVPSEDALRKIAFNVASASGGRSKKNARARKIRGGRGGGMSERDGKRRKYGMRARATETGSWQKEDGDEKQRQQERETSLLF